jgi:hypothetical protein
VAGQIAARLCSHETHGAGLTAAPSNASAATGLTSCRPWKTSRVIDGLECPSWSAITRAVSPALSTIAAFRNTCDVTQANPSSVKTVAVQVVPSVRRTTTSTLSTASTPLVRRHQERGLEVIRLHPVSRSSNKIIVIFHHLRATVAHHVAGCVGWRWVRLSTMRLRVKSNRSCPVPEVSSAA